MYVKQKNRKIDTFIFKGCIQLPPLKKSKMSTIQNYTNYIKNMAQKYLWEPAVQVNTSSEAIVQYITTFGFAIIYYLGIANLFVGFSLLYNVHKSILHSFPTYITELRNVGHEWFPSLIPHIPIEKDYGIMDGIPSVASNPCNLDCTHEDSNEVQDWGGEDSSENESAETSELTSSPESIIEGVRPPSNSMEGGVDLLIKAAEKLEEITGTTVDGHPHAD